MRASTPLVLDVLCHDCQWCPTARSHEVRPAPKHRLGVGTPQVVELRSHPTRRYRLQGVDQLRKLHLGGVLDQQVYMITFTMTLTKLGLEVSANFASNLLEGFMVKLTENLTAVFRHEDNVDVEQVGAVTRLVDLVHTDG